MTLLVRFQCDRCERIKESAYVNAQQLTGGYNLLLGGLSYYICNECEMSLAEWLTNKGVTNVQPNDVVSG
jgi:hypothetical protein